MRKFVSFIAIAATILAAGACNKQEQPDDESGKMSDLQYLIDGLVRTDDAGNITGYIVGDSLNEANPWEISVPANNYDEAAAIFRDLLPDGAQVTTSGSTLIWTMTDEEGKPEATAEFAEDPGLGAIATVTVKPVLQAGAAKQVSPSVHFILTSTWPKNSWTIEDELRVEYYVGRVVKLSKDWGFGKGRFLIVRGWTPTEAGIMVRLSEGYDSHALCSMRALRRTYKAIQANYDIVADYAEREGWPSFDRWYWSGNTKWLVKNGFLNMKTGKEKWSFKEPSNSAMPYMYYFGPDGKDDVKYY
jgi:hypothetical protein